MRPVRCGNPPHFVSSLWRWYLADAAIRVATRPRFALLHKERFGRGWGGGGCGTDGGGGGGGGEKRKKRRKRLGGGGRGVGGGGGEEERKRENVTTSFES